MAKQVTTFQDDAGRTSFTRVMSGIITIWCLLLLTISLFKNGSLPTWEGAGPVVTLIGFALSGKVIQKPFENRKPK